MSWARRLQDPRKLLAFLLAASWLLVIRGGSWCERPGDHHLDATAACVNNIAVARSAVDANRNSDLPLASNPALRPARALAGDATRHGQTKALGSVLLRDLLSQRIC